MISTLIGDPQDVIYEHYYKTLETLQSNFCYTDLCLLHSHLPWGQGNHLLLFLDRKNLGFYLNFFKGDTIEIKHKNKIFTLVLGADFPSNFKYVRLVKKGKLRKSFEKNILCEPLNYKYEVEQKFKEHLIEQLSLQNFNKEKFLKFGFKVKPTKSEILTNISFPMIKDVMDYEWILLDKKSVGNSLKKEKKKATIEAYRSVILEKCEKLVKKIKVSK